MTKITSPPHPNELLAYGPAGRSPWLDVDWRDYQHWINVNDNVVNVIDLGEGPPIVFVHGLSGSWPNWLEQLPVFAAQHRVIALDLPGFGHSAMPREQISISGYARLLDGLLDQLGVDAAAVVGNSMGGFIAAELAIGVPQRVERLVLISAAGLSTFEHPGALRSLPHFRRWERIITAYAGWTASKSDAVTRRPRLRQAALGLVVAHPGRLQAALAAEQVRGAGKPGFVDALDATLNYDFRERLPEIACPTLIAWGDRDRIITVRDADLYEQLIAGSRKMIFEDTGHLAMLERPSAFNALLADFLAQ